MHRLPVGIANFTLIAGELSVHSIRTPGFQNAHTRLTGNRLKVLSNFICGVCRQITSNRAHWNYEFC